MSTKSFYQIGSGSRYVSKESTIDPIAQNAYNLYQGTTTTGSQGYSNLGNAVAYIWSYLTGSGINRNTIIDLFKLSPTAGVQILEGIIRPDLVGVPSTVSAVSLQWLLDPLGLDLETLTNVMGLTSLNANSTLQTLCGYNDGATPGTCTYQAQITWSIGSQQGIENTWTFQAPCYGTQAQVTQSATSSYRAEYPTRTVGQVSNLTAFYNAVVESYTLNTFAGSVTVTSSTPGGVAGQSFSEIASQNNFQGTPSSYYVTYPFDKSRVESGAQDFFNNYIAGILGALSAGTVTNPVFSGYSQISTSNPPNIIYPGQCSYIVNVAWSEGGQTGTTQGYQFKGPCGGTADQILQNAKLGYINQFPTRSITSITGLAGFYDARLDSYTSNTFAGSSSVSVGEFISVLGPQNGQPGSYAVAYPATASSIASDAVNYFNNNLASVFNAGGFATASSPVFSNYYQV